MPPKQRITREMILQSAFTMFVNEGMAVVNARSVAKALGCSTQPIFSYFTGMQELKDALDEKAQEMYADKVASFAMSENWLADICVEHVRFACMYPHVYMHLCAAVRENLSRLDAYSALFAALVAHVQQKEGVSEETARKVVDEVGIYANGLINRLLIKGLDSTDVGSRIADAYRVVLASLK